MLSTVKYSPEMISDDLTFFSYFAQIFQQLFRACLKSKMQIFAPYLFHSNTQPHLPTVFFQSLSRTVSHDISQELSDLCLRPETFVQQTPKQLATV